PARCSRATPWRRDRLDTMGATIGPNYSHRRRGKRLDRSDFQNSVAMFPAAGEINDAFRVCTARQTQSGQNSIATKQAQLDLWLRVAPCYYAVSVVLFLCFRSISRSCSSSFNSCSTPLDREIKFKAGSTSPQ